MMVSFRTISSETTRIDDQKTNKKRKRKLMKDLKLYTVQRGEEPAFRGWSSRAYSDMASHRVAITKESGLYKRFDMAYRQLYGIMNKNPNCARAGEQVVTDTEYSELFDFPVVSV
jgi:hypothetical protein